MQDIREAFAGKTPITPRVYVALRTAPDVHAPEAALPAAGAIGSTEVWAEFEIGIGEVTHVLIASPGIPAEEQVLKSLQPGVRVHPIPERRSEVADALAEGDANDENHDNPNGQEQP